MGDARDMFIKNKICFKFGCCDMNLNGGDSNT